MVSDNSVLDWIMLSGGPGICAAEKTELCKNIVRISVSQPLFHVYITAEADVGVSGLCMHCNARFVSVKERLSGIYTLMSFM